ncbi:MAG TPA: TerC family protein [Gemmatimonadaceae bacterium]|nr:TerC family protein [Gemmatimonadaceae bacterium]
MATNIWFWIGFIAFVLAMLALDLGVFHKKAHVVRPKEAGYWVTAWISLALLFAAGLWAWESRTIALTFLTGYVIELSLSVDNLFVMVVIFSYFRVPPQSLHRVLFYGILGALIMRGIFIGVGAFLLARFEWILYVFGAMLVITGVRMMFKQDEEFDGENNKIVKMVRRRVPMTMEYHDSKFFTIENGQKLATPLFLVLILIEFTDLIFAVDSIPAIFGITRDPFIVFTSNIFAILGLRSMFFLLAAVVERFYLLKYGLAVILTFIGVKMLIEHWYHIPIMWSLGVVLGTLVLSVIGSLIWPQPEKAPEPMKPDGEKTGSIFGSVMPRSDRDES